MTDKIKEKNPYVDYLKEEEIKIKLEEAINDYEKRKDFLDDLLKQLQGRLK